MNNLIFSLLLKVYEKREKKSKKKGKRGGRIAVPKFFRFPAK